MFPFVWLHFKKFSRKYFLVFGKEEGKHKSRKTQATTQKKIINDRDPRSRSCRRDLTKARSRSRERIVISRRQDRDQRRDLANDRDLAKARSRSTSRSRDSAISRSVDRGRQTGAREIGDPITSTYRTRRNPQSPTTIFICMNFFVIGCRE